MGLTLTYDPNIPLPGDNPSDSQSEILTNFASIGAVSGSWTTQDHYGFGTGTDGQHKLLNFPANNSLGSQAGLASAVNTAPGVALNSSSQLMYKNSVATLPLSGVRAFGIASNASNYGATSPLNGFNVTSVSSGSAQVTVVMPAGVVTGTNYSVICSTTAGIGGQDQISITYTIDSATQFRIRTVDIPGNVLRNTNTVSFTVLQF